MLRSERGITRVKLAITVIVALIFAAIIVRVLVGEDSIIQQKKEENARKQYENNIVIELTNSSN
ncbi:MAG: hypothetical protein IJH12_04375 [Clostridia bacterium]|nr:hypothetical protein [Clostridia bacterium]